jgi:hypothetical protein
MLQCIFPLVSTVHAHQYKNWDCFPTDFVVGDEFKEDTPHMMVEAKFGIPESKMVGLTFVSSLLHIFSIQGTRYWTREHKVFLRCDQGCKNSGLEWTGRFIFLSSGKKTGKLRSIRVEQFLEWHPRAA